MVNRIASASTEEPWDAGKPRSLRDTSFLTIDAAAPAAEWDAYVTAHEDGTVEHLAGWRDVYKRAFHHDCVYLAARRHGRVVGVLPLVRYRSLLFGKFVVSLPYFNYAGIVSDDAVAAGALIERARTLAEEHGARHIEFRHRARQLPGYPSRNTKASFTRALPESTDALWSALDRKVRNQVRKAQKAGLTSIDGGGEQVEAFYSVFAENMRDLGTPVFPKALFTETLRIFPGRAHVFVVRAGDTPVAAGMALTFRDTVLVPWASSRKSSRELCPNMLLYWAMMAWAVGRGLRVFDFGRSTVGAGTQQFKEQWGGAARALHTEYVLLAGGEPPDQGTGNPKMAAAISVWRRLPVAIATRFGPAVVRHLS